MSVHEEKTKIVNKAIDDWKDDIYDVDAARYGIYVSLTNQFCCSFFSDFFPGDGVPLGLHAPEVEFRLICILPDMFSSTYPALYSLLVQILVQELQEIGLKDVQIKLDIRKAIKDEWSAQMDEVKRNGKEKLLKVREKLLKVRKALDEGWRETEAGKNDPKPFFSDDAIEHVLENLGLPPMDNTERRHVGDGEGHAGAVAGEGGQDAGNAGEKDHEKEKRKGKGPEEQKVVEEVVSVGGEKHECASQASQGSAEGLAEGPSSPSANNAPPPRPEAGGGTGQGAQAAGGVGGIGSRQESPRQVSVCMCVCAFVFVYIYVRTYMMRTHVCVSTCACACTHTSVNA